MTDQDQDTLCSIISLSDSDTEREPTPHLPDDDDTDEDTVCLSAASAVPACFLLFATRVHGPSYTCMNLSPTGRTTGAALCDAGRTTGATGRTTGALGDGAGYGKNLAPSHTARLGSRVPSPTAQPSHA